MKVSLDPVIAAVTAQKNAYSELLDLARAKRETIVSGDINQLDVILAAESDLLHQLGSLEQSRSQASQALAQQLGQRPEDLTWSSLPWQNSRQRQAMEKLQHEFAGILDALQQVNEVNSRLLTMHLDYVHELMNTVTKTVESSSYDAAGNPQPLRQQSVNLIDKVW